MKDFDIIVVGAGIGGIYALHRLRSLGLSVLVVEAGSDVGGTWFWNRYPGARCDIESVDYSYSFSDALEQEWNWSEKYAAQPEILRYINHVVDRFDLRKNMQFNTRVTAATFDESTGRWTVGTDGGQLSAQFLVMATGLLSVPLEPNIAGRENFAGRQYYTSRWPDTPVDFSGQTVGVIGTGSSGNQIVPMLAKQAKRLLVFQRTASYSVPMRNKPLAPADLQAVRAGYRARRKAMRESGFGTYWSAYELGSQKALDVSEDEREREFNARWDRGGVWFLGAYTDLMSDLDANRTASDFVRGKIREIITDPDIAEKLVPADDLPIGCKRLCTSDGFFEAFNRDNVTLVDLSEDPIEKIVESGIKTRASIHELDALVFATGFDAFTGALTKINFHGVGGAELKEKWRDGPITYLGIMVSGFPNLFMINGPHVVAANLFPSTEAIVDWITQLISHIEAKGGVSVDVRPEAETWWMELVGAVGERAVVSNSCTSWRTGSNVPGKPRVLMAYLGGLHDYIQLIEHVKSSDYQELIIA